MLTHIGNLFAFIGGLGMFLYGMDIMASGLQKTAGSKMKELLGYLTNNRFLGVLVRYPRSSFILLPAVF